MALYGMGCKSKNEEVISTETVQDVESTAAVTEPSENESTTEEESESEDVVFSKLDIGETEQKECWTETTVSANNIGGNFVVDVCLPDEYDKNNTYPVVYLTDCNWRRRDYPAIKELYQSGKTKDFILVGIGYPSDYDCDAIRVRDLLNDPDQFLDMIVNGILPYIEETYSVDPKDRTFCGASYGASFMIYSLFQSDGVTKDIFKNYVFASPNFLRSMGGTDLGEYEDRYRRRTTTLNANVYMTVGGDEAGTTIRSLRNFNKRLEKREYSGLNLTYKVYDGKIHETVWVPTLLDGLEMYLAK